MVDEQRLEEAWGAWIDEGPPIGECGGIGPDPNPPKTLKKLQDGERFITHEDDMLTDAEIKKLPPADEDYRDAPDF